MYEYTRTRSYILVLQYLVPLYPQTVLCEESTPSRPSGRPHECGAWPSWRAQSAPVATSPCHAMGGHSPARLIGSTPVALQQQDRDVPNVGEELVSTRNQLAHRSGYTAVERHMAPRPLIRTGWQCIERVRPNSHSSTEYSPRVSVQAAEGHRRESGPVSVFLHTSIQRV